MANMLRRAHPFGLIPADGTCSSEECGAAIPRREQFSERGRLHLAHDVAAMELDRDFADAEVEGDLLVEASARHFTQDLPLARRQRRKPLDIAL